MGRNTKFMSIAIGHFEVQARRLVPDQVLGKYIKVSGTSQGARLLPRGQVLSKVPGTEQNGRYLARYQVLSKIPGTE